MLPNRAITDLPTAIRPVLVLLAFSLVGQALAEPPPPNVVLIVADDLGYAELGCYGQKWIKTPYLDELAANGMRFTQFYSGSPVCAPSRCVLLTGKHSGHSFIRNNGAFQPEGQRPIPAEEVTIAELLKPAGYGTAAIGKWGLGMVGTTGDPNLQGFDLFYGFNCQRHAHNHYPKYLWKNQEREDLAGNNRTLSGEKYSQDLFREQALQFVREHREQPFLLYLPFAIPHLAIQVPEESLAEYRDKIPEHDYKHRGYWKHPHPHAGYAAMITHMDRDIGKLVALLDELGLRENTLILFTSDNGPTHNRLGGSDSKFFQSGGGLRGRKGSVYEGGVRVPLIANWPGRISAGSESDHVAIFYDLLPTIAETAGVAAPAGLDGISFLPTLTGQPQQEHKAIYWEFPSSGGQQAIRMGDWKLVRQDLKRKNQRAAKLELYNLATDRDETTDVAAENPEVVARMRAVMKEMHVPSPEFPFPALDAESS